MQGYFEKLIENYGAQESSFPAEMPLTHEVEAPESPVAAAQPAVDTKTPQSHTGVKEAPAAIVSPDINPSTEEFDQDLFIPDPLEKSTPERIERLTERVIEQVPAKVAQAKQTKITDEPVIQKAQFEPAPVSVTHQHEHIHVHEASPPIPGPVAEGVEPSAPLAAPDSPDPLPLPELHDRSALVDLEAHLAKALSQIHGVEKDESVPRITAADFEPADEGAPLLLESETVREVTREVVKEIHRHHHETRIEQVALRAPRSAEEASQIGRIRFASVWDRQGGR
ncbi:hypothetical protein SAMN05216420_102322 [Nitrosospira sp. Nl5]|uniref:hypothetical protein n=1 Tax=Nitrosospira sp. Nl5 TaxID=200120 RepID=UPI000885C011|nr:hypothetical protein [Nitrosospira sp. Nl5]SCY10775.1 hypothetical protein SAMN05216420_102322 [Nitrosospira sp. Nl5]